MQSLPRCIALAAMGLSLLTAAARAAAQETAEPPATTPAADAEQPKPAAPVEIPDEPKTVDPAGLVPEKLGSPATVTFADATLTEIAAWIRDEQKYPVLFDERALDEAGVLLSDSVTDHLDGQPVYLLLNRLRRSGVAWYVADDILHLTAPEVADERISTVQYNVSDLLDDGYDADTLKEVIGNETEGPWLDIDGVGGSLQLLGDVLFVRQSDHVQREVAALLTALRRHARMTFVFQPPQNLALREKLQQHVTADFASTPLGMAIEDLGTQAGADVRLDMAALPDVGVRDRQPVSLQLADRPLSTVLQVLISDLGLTWLVEDGVIWVTSGEAAEKSLETAIYDVRDLCRDGSESDALQDAIQEQTRGPWLDIDGIGGVITFAKPGAMVVRQTDEGLLELLELLETYRAALRASKPRPRSVIDPEEFIATYYRMQTDTAQDLAKILPRLVRPGTWNDNLNPDAKGYILVVASGADLRDAHGREIVAKPGPDEARPNALVVSHAVLIVNQTRAAHEDIAKIIERVKSGDATEGGLGGGGFGGGGFGGGGFGGGFFSPRTPEK